MKKKKNKQIAFTICATTPGPFPCKPDRCSECIMVVYVSMTTLERSSEYDLKILCRDCGLRLLPNGPGSMAHLSKSQKSELESFGMNYPDLDLAWELLKKHSI